MCRSFSDRLFIKRNAEKLIFLFAVLTASLVTVIGFRQVEAAGRQELQEHLAGQVLRFHVIANSDSDEDQELKLQVRDAVLDYFADEMPESGDASQAAAWARQHTDEIEDVGRRALAEAGSDETVNAAVTTCFFPDRTYGDMTFPAGNYEALRVEIGAAEGHKDVYKRQTLITDAADAGLLEAKDKLGVMYLKGQGVAVDYKEALKWFSRAAEKGYSWSMYHMGEMYYDGKGVSRSYDTARMLFSKAAGQGNQAAMYEIGLMRCV